MEFSFSKHTRCGRIGLLGMLLLAILSPDAQAAYVLAISGTPATSVTAGKTYAFQPSLTNSTGRTASFSIVNKPSWATFSSSTGRLAGTPQTAHVGTYSNIVITAKAGGRTAQLPVFSIKVLMPNRAPAIGGTPSTQILAGSVYWFKPTASDADGNTLTFSISNRPSWARFNSTNGAIGGTPTTANVGTYGNIVISVTDGRGGYASLPAFAIAVKAPNRAPTIGGAPAPQVIESNSYWFKPTASDADGNTLTFSIANRPAWASFSPSTGVLGGTPTGAQVGTYSNIVISVSDGYGASAALPAFAIAVVQSATGSVSLSWLPPTQNADGTTLADLAGYRVYYGTSAGGPYSTSVSIANPSVSTYLVENLTPGTYYFVVTARNTAGVESSFSGQVAKTLN